MRNILMICGATLLFAACKGDGDLETKKDVIVTDTSSMYKSNASSDTGVNVDVIATPPPQRVQVKTVTRTVYVDRPVAARRRTVRQAAPAPVYREPNNNQGSQNTDNTGNTNNENNSGTNTNGSTTTAPAPAPVEKDKGWSNSTKGAVIGGVGGAIGGAILSKKKGKGAVIGGVIGAAGGYILGRKKDRQDTTR